MPDKPVIYRERPVPFEVVGLAAASIVGIIMLFTDVSPNSIEDALSDPFRVAWSFTLGFGSLLALIGILFGGARGIFFEQIGILSAGGACLVYSAALISWRPEITSAMSFGMVTAYGLACLWRFGQLVRLVNYADRLQTHRRGERKSSGG